MRGFASSVKMYNLVIWLDAPARWLNLADSWLGCFYLQWNLSPLESKGVDHSLRAVIHPMKFPGYLDAAFPCRTFGTVEHKEGRRGAERSFASRKNMSCSPGFSPSCLFFKWKNQRLAVQTK